MRSQYEIEGSIEKTEALAEDERRCAELKTAERRGWNAALKWVLEGN